MEYFILLSIPILLMPIYGNRHFRKTYGFFIVFYFIILILFSGLRWQTGTDWDPYLDYFRTLDNINLFEAGYIALNRIVRAFSDNYTVFLIIDSLVAIIPVWIITKRENQCNPLSLAIFFPYYYTVNYLGSNRRIIALGFCMLALIPLVNKKFWEFFALCMVAFFFHRSSLVFLFSWPLFHGKYKTKHYVIFSLITVACLAWNPLLNIPNILPSSPSTVIFQKLLIYSSNESKNPNVNYMLQDIFSVAKRLAFVLLMLLGLMRINPEEKSKYVGYLNIYLFSLFLYILFTGSIEIFKSITDYFSIVEIFLIPRAVMAINKNIRPLMYGALIIYLFAQEYSALLSYWDLYVPYRSIFFGAT